MNPVNEAALQQFDRMPDYAHVRLPVVCALFGVSPATVWRWSRDGRLPRPVRLNGVTLWNVGELKLTLQALQLQEPVLPAQGRPPRASRPVVGRRH